VELSYCVSSSLTADPVAITKVQIGSFSNPSGKSTYTDFMNLTANMNRGQTYNVTITTDSTFWPANVRIWIDYNRNGVLNDTGEKVFEGWMQDQQSGQPITGSFTVPSSSVVTGQKLVMRISLRVNGYRNVCEKNDGKGEVEDYGVLIQ